VIRSAALAGVCLSLLPWIASGQIRLGLSVAPSPALHHERATARLNILNEAGDPLDFGTNGNARLRYVVRDHRGQLAIRWQGDGEVSHEPLVIRPSLMGTVTNLLNDSYRLDPGSYAVEAEVEWGGLIFTSEKRYLEVVPGVTIAELKTGLPGGRWTRHFALKVLSRDRQDHIFLRIEDASADRCLGVLDLGRHVRMEPPTMRVDGSGYLHILHQSGPFNHVYSVISPNGDLDRCSAHGGEYKAVRLKTLNDGSVEISESASGELPPVPPADLIPNLPIGWKDRRPSSKD
jgi:hypothetical protein